MRIKYLLTVASFSIIASSGYVPVMAEHTISKQVESQSIKNQNKNSSEAIIGNWKASVNENGKKLDIYWNVNPDGTTSYIFQSNTRQAQSNSTWKYSNGTLLEELSSGVTAKASIDWISNDEFILTIIDNGNPQSRGVERRYYRQQESPSNFNLSAERTLYGSIAIHGNGNHGIGYSWNYANKQEAIDAALQSCFEKTRGKCKTAIWFSNGCGALATSPLSWGAAYSDDRLAAQHNALAQCPSDYCKIQKVVCIGDPAQ